MALPRGIDVASHQGHVAWPEVAANGMAFAFTKSSGGIWYRNPFFDEHWAGIRAAGMARGAYHYAFESSGQPFPGPGPEAEAEYFLETVLAQGPLLEGDMLVLDIEEGPADVDLGLWALRWLDRVRDRVGFRPLLYTGAWFSDPHGFGRHPALSAYPLWLAAYQEPMPPAPAPWPMVAFWQFTSSGSVPGVSGDCDVNELTMAGGSLGLYGKLDGAVAVLPPVAAVGPRYDASYPAIAQNDDWSCSCTSMRWALWAYARQPSEAWLENSMLAEGVVSTSLGLMDATGKGLAQWASRHYGEFGYRGEHDPSVTFDEVAQEAAEGRHPLCLGGRGWYHWSGVRGAADGKILLANPGPGWKGVAQTLSREQWEYLGPWSMVRLVHTSESVVAPPPTTLPPPTDPFAAYRGGIGSGILDMMAADGVVPAQRASSWYPPGAKPSDVETCYGSDGTLYTWLLTEGKGFKYPPT